MEVFSHRPGNAQPIVGARTTTDLIENNQTALCCIIQNIGRFIHLDHKRRVPPSELITRANTGKNTIDQPETTLPSWHPGTHLSHKHN